MLFSSRSRRCSRRGSVERTDGRVCVKIACRTRITTPLLPPSTLLNLTLSSFASPSSRFFTGSSALFPFIPRYCSPTNLPIAAKPVMLEFSLAFFFILPDALPWPMRLWRVSRKKKL